MSDGALLIGQSGGATAVVNASLVGAIEAARARGSFDRILGMRNGIEGLLAEQLLDLSDVPLQELDALRVTPGAALGTSRLKANDDQLDLAVAVLHQHDVRGVVLIGGNDSADTARRLHERTGGEIPAVLAPKTVDNDLMETDFCPGFPSAAKFLANVVRDATWDSLSAPKLYPVKLIEVPGRDAGWLPLSGALGLAGRDADIHPLVFPPEAPPESAEALVQAIVTRIETHGFAVAIVPETLRDASGKHLGGDEPEYIDPFGHPYFASAGEGIARILRSAAGVRARVERPGSATRMSISLVSSIDQSLAYLCGRAAADALAHRHGGVMIGIERDAGLHPGFTTHYVDLGEVANRVRSLPQAYFDPRKHAPTDDFFTYALPLLGPDPFPPYERLDPAI
ncbi:MAG TPA: diphosphate--fructose-6-phosphate 1-phosphotransferase [Thermomicrobiales bacterium]|nr:diphosphate--fructose-6-phosphate 1-phosphotransferase [Thermomicrobiales bacterium]